MSFISPPRGASGLFGGRGAYTVTTPAPATVFTKLTDADAALRTALSAAIAHVAGLGLAAKDAPVPAAVIAASPGAGKSRVARELLSTAAGHARVLFHAPTLALCEEAADHARELGGMAHVVRGRLAPDPTDPSQQMCRKSSLVARGLRLGLNIRETFCFNEEARCEHADSCAWMRQFDPEHAVGHRYLATSYLGYPDPDGYEGNLRVVDETFWGGQLSFATVDVEEFCLPRTFLQHFTRRGRKDARRVTAHADLIAAARAVVDALRGDRSPLDLPYTEEDYRGFARLEYSAEAQSPAPTPDLPQDQQAQLLAQAEAALRHVSRYAAVWTCLAQAKTAGRRTLERIRIVTSDGRSALRVCRKHATEHRQPMLVLDADADPEILGALEIDVQRTAHMVLRPQAEVLQVHDRRMTHTSLLRGSKLREEWRRIIRREVLRDREGQGGGVLVGASRKVILRLFEDAGYDFEGLPDAEVSRRMLETPLHGARWLWFGGRSLGTNLYRNASTVIVIGREELPVDALEDYGRALWGDRTDADLCFIEPDKDGIRRLPDQELLYEMTDGSAVGVLVPCHPDPLIRRVQMQTRELATRQLVERLRLARSNTRKRVILGCNMPVPGLPVDALIAWDDLCLDRPAAALVDAVLETGGIRLSDAGLVKDAPRIFPTLDAVKAFRKRGSINATDMIEALPTMLRSRMHVVQLQQDRPYARLCKALVFAGSVEDACRQAELIWGPMRHCSVAPQAMQIWSNLEPRSGT
ncbi:hypothetical protein [Seohaeicola zhoushanensis]|uniref:Uncharacterized protein n=1 Tax=Seohaeicola zhoushanensis TaxID=1569283 RepID=A0A8J3H2E2_9RHOB|nr:hypothetical protein [Seohaeicola zhoushanensis]GHF67514.1 hypothetical protein GCM10017056_43450 [Seohaeicola zhoushanensis]